MLYIHPQYFKNGEIWDFKGHLPSHLAWGQISQQTVQFTLHTQAYAGTMLGRCFFDLKKLRSDLISNT